MFWGAGIAYAEPLREPLLAAEPEAAPELLGIVPHEFFGQPGALEDLSERWPLVMHGAGASVGTMGRPSAAWVAGVAELVRRARPLMLSESLAMSRSPDGLDLGTPAPLWYTHEQLRGAADNVGLLQRELAIPVAVANVAAPFVLGPADFDEPEFFAALAEATGCGLHLDLSAVARTAALAGVAAADWLARYPLERVWVVAVDLGDESLSLLSRLHARAHVRAILIHTESDDTPLTRRVAQARRARRIWTDRDVDPLSDRPA